MEFFERQDVARIVALLAAAGDPTSQLSVPERKRLVLQQTCELISADAWNWSTVVVNAARPGDVAPLAQIDGGWTDERQRTRYYELLLNAKVTSPALVHCQQAHASQSHHTLIHSDLLRDPAFWQQFTAIGVGDVMSSIYPLNHDMASTATFFRMVGGPRFTERERAIAHLVFQQVDWLHRDDVANPSTESMLRLSPRQRQVLIYLLSGDSQKQIAVRLGISAHTVGDYIKDVYRQLKVNSRGELLSIFICGGQKPASPAN